MFSKKKKCRSASVVTAIECPGVEVKERAGGGKGHIGAGWSDSILMNTAGLARVTDSPRGAHRTADRAFKGEEKLQQCVSQIPPIKRNLYNAGSDWTGESKTAKFVFSSE